MVTAPTRFECLNVGVEEKFVPASLDNIHADDQAVLKAEAVTNAGVGDELAGVRVVDHLMDIYCDVAVWLFGEDLGLDPAGEGSKLPIPVITNRFATDNPATLPGVRPIDLRMHQIDRSVDVARVERTVGEPQRLLGIPHATNLASPSRYSFTRRQKPVKRYW